MLYLRATKMISGATASAIPLYLPPEKEYLENGFDHNVFFGAISLYLREKVHFMEKMPAFLDKILDAPPLLKIASGMAGTTRSEGLEDITLNMIDGSNTIREKEVERLVKYLVKEGKPDIIHLSNALIIGLAKQIKDHLDVKIVCSLQNEDDWLNEMAEPFQSQAWRMIAAEVKNVDAFISPSRYYKDFFVARTGISGERIQVVPTGIGLSPEYDVSKTDPAPAIGFFSRVNSHNGFDKLADAFINLKKESYYRDLTLHICGGYTGVDKPFIREQIGKLKEAGQKSFVKIYPEFQGRSKHDFLGSVDLISVPVRKYDGYGLYILEANAAGIPVVQPSTGAFPEIIDMTGGGIIYDPDTVEELTIRIASLLEDKEKATALGRLGSENVRTRLSLKEMSDGLAEAYSTIRF
jgi:glycosyltransferase involved in cell wall biosynthesis